MKPLFVNVKAVVTDNRGLVPYVVPVAAESAQKLHLEFHDKQGKFRADVLPVDELVAATNVKPSFVKIDVDRLEVRVLRSMRNSIAGFRPTILLELHPPFWRSGKTQDLIFEKLPGYGFDLIREEDFGDHPGMKCSRFLCSARSKA